jgi:hypothetical protein
MTAALRHSSSGYFLEIGKSISIQLKLDDFPYSEISVFSGEVAAWTGKFGILLLW